jgi:RNA-directed DNA polymerase
MGSGRAAAVRTRSKRSSRHSAAKNAKRLWILDADLAAAFDKIDHDCLLSALGSFPTRGMIGQWLKAGVVEQGALAATEEGTPQGGVISPLLLNVALHGLEGAAGVRYVWTGRNAGETKPGCPVLVRYADDLLAMCHSREQAQQVKAQLADWLAPRGLVFNEDKTRIVHATDGLDFLGFSIRRYPNGKLLIKPSKMAMKRIRRRLSAEMRSLRGAGAAAVPYTINPIVRGWAAYYRSAVSSEAFSALDRHMWNLTYKWGRYRHPNKPKRWIVDRYYGTFNQSRADRWVFGDRDSGTYLRKFAWTKIVRHQMVKSSASPDDPALATYWAERRRKNRPPLDGHILRLIRAQQGRCHLCGTYLLHADSQPQSPQEWEQWLRTTRKAITRQHIVAHTRDGPADDVRLIHADCGRRHHSARTGPAHLHACKPSGLA